MDSHSKSTHDFDFVLFGKSIKEQGVAETLLLAPFDYWWLAQALFLSVSLPTAVSQADKAAARLAMRLSHRVLELFQNVEESERGSGCRGCWLVLHRIGYYSWRGHQQCGFLIRKTIGYMCIFCWGRYGKLGFEQP
jgi:hypothetical protein